MCQGSQEEARFLAAMDVFFGGATTTYVFRRGRPVQPYLDALQIEPILKFMRGRPAGASTNDPAGSNIPAPKSKTSQTDDTGATKQQRKPAEGVPEPSKAHAQAGRANSGGGADRRADATRAAASQLVRELTMKTASEATNSHIKLQVGSVVPCIHLIGRQKNIRPCCGCIPKHPWCVHATKIWGRSVTPM